MRDINGNVLYVGKAKSLKNRVRTYFRSSGDKTRKTVIMVSKIHDFETIETETEKQALILEHSLIKKHRPRFNILFRDDKEYPYLRLSMKSPYPFLSIVRKPYRDGAVYFGPFASSKAVRETLRVINRIFPMRKCSGDQLKRKRPCMYYQLGQCFAPCVNDINREEYLKIVKDVRHFLSGNGKKIIQNLTCRMKAESDNLNFEMAAKIRNQIRAIEKTLEKQVIVSLDSLHRDVFSFCRQDDIMAVTGLFVRNGRMLGSRNFFLNKVYLPDSETLSSFVSQYYYSGEFIPDEIVVPLDFEDRELLQQWLMESRGRKVVIVKPRQGRKKGLLKIAEKNAQVMLEKKLSDFSDAEAALVQLQQELHLKEIPVRIECFDISNISGSSAAGSMVVFENGFQFKKGYRKFRIKNVSQPDDYAMMYEVLLRHLKRAGEEQKLPQLIIVDGGKGQLNVLLRVLRECGADGVDAIALAKAKPGLKSNSGVEKVFLPGRKNPVIFSKYSRALLLLQRIRDEAHRFAVSYHRTLKKKNDFTSAIEDLSGIGKKTAMAVLKYFGSLQQASQAPVEEFMKIESMTIKRAESLYSFFRQTRQKS